MIEDTSESAQSGSSVRCAKALGNNIYIGLADGSLVRCTLQNDGPSTGDAYAVVSWQVAANKKPIDDIVLAPSVSKAMVLAGGTIYCYTLPTFDPIPTNVIQPIRGVAAFSLDNEDQRKDHYAPIRPAPAPAPAPTSGLSIAPWVGRDRDKDKVQLDPVSMYVFRDTKIFHYTLTQRMVPTKTEVLALERPPAKVVRSGRYLCIADSEYYSMGDLEDRTQILLAPIPPGVVPLIAYVQPGEFLIASPIGDTSLGVFLNGSAEPTRNAIEWPKHPRSFTIDSGYVLALLAEPACIQIHSLPEAVTQPDLLYTISFTSPPEPTPSLLSFNPGSFLVPTTERASLVKFVKFRLLGGTTYTSSVPSSTTTTSSDPAATLSSALIPSSSLASNLNVSSSTTPPPPATPQPPALSFLDSTTLVISSSGGIQACIPPAFLSKVERLLEGGRIGEATMMAEPFAPGPIDMSNDYVIDRLYLFARLALRCLRDTMFDDAGEYIFHSRLDPRILIRLFPDLAGKLIRESDAVNVFAGMERDLRPGETISDIIMANLVRNYRSIEPNVQTAPSTVELNNILMESARVMLMRYLRRVREARGGNGDGVNGGRVWSEEELVKWRAVDTVYLKLLAETSQRAEVQEMFLSTPNTIMLDEILPTLESHGYYSLLIDMHRRAGNEERLLQIWSRLVEGDRADPSVVNPLGEIIQVLSTTSNRELIRKYGVWLAKQEPVAAFTLFASLPPTPKPPRRGPQSLVGPSLEQTVLNALRESSSLVADQYLEFLVLNRNSEEPIFHEELANKYIDEVINCLKNPETIEEVKMLSSSYTATSSRGSFPLYLAIQRPSTDFRTARLKMLLFLQGSSVYDAVAARKRLDLHKDLLLLERAILDGKLGNDRSALTLLVQLGDTVSAEAYCTLGGEVIPGKIALKVGEIANLEEWARLVAAPRALSSSNGKAPALKRGKTIDPERTKALLKILMEVYTHGGREAMSRETADLLNSQGVNLEISDVLSSVPPSWSLSNISSFLTRSFRRSQHMIHEESIIKGISWGQNLCVTDHAFAVIRGQGGVIEEPDSSITASSAPSEGGEPSSFTEKDKVIIPGPEPVIGSVTTVDLAKKEGFSEDHDGVDDSLA